MDRHLLPNEIDLLLDGEVGFGTSPLKAHVRRCPHCRAELDEARSLVRTLEHLPHLTPSPRFAEQVMARVHLYVPWYIALLDSVRAWIPRSRPARAIAGAVAVSVLAIVTAFTLWLVSQVDALTLAFELGIGRIRDATLIWLANALAGAVGEPTMQLMRTFGWLGVAGTLVALALVTTGAASLLRGLARARGR